MVLAALASIECGGGLLPGALPSPTLLPPERSSVVIDVVTPENFIQLPIAVAAALGYFKSAGLDVTFSGSLAGLTALSQGQVDMISLPFENTIRAQYAGTDLEMVVLYQLRPGFVLSTGEPHFNDVHTMRDLIGKPVGVTALGGPSETWVRWLALREGVNPDSISYKAVGVGTAMSSAIASGSVWAGHQVDPPASRMEKNGTGRVLYDTRTEAGAKQIYGGNGVYPGNGLMLPRDFANRYPRTTQALVTAIVRALRFIHSHSASQIAAAVPSLYAQGDAENYVASLKNNLGMFSPDGIVPPAGAQTVLNVVKQVVPAIGGTSIDIALTYDNTFVRKAGAA